MPQRLEIALAPERLSEGSPEERAAFGLFTIRTTLASLTEGFDSFVNSYRPGPLVSGYHVAEWFTWNWWRLRWEPKSAARDWDFAHKMTSIGEGYVWPNLTIFSDGVRTAIISEPSARPDAKPFRYVGALPTVVPSTVFETAIDTFIPQILERLQTEGAKDSNLALLWSDVITERNDPEIAKRRRLEAYLGREPEAADDDAVERLLADAARLGDAALEEVAADSAQRLNNGNVPTAATFEHLALTRGHDASPRDAAKLDSEHKVARGAEVPAWRLGAQVAQALRVQEKIGASTISNERLAQMVGTRIATVTDTNTGGTDLSFALDNGPMASRIVLRSKWEQGRRFDLARLLGDRLIDARGALHPATRASTYRQKAQRAFAAELLSPFEVVEEMLSGDYSAESQQDVAERFNVSYLTIDTLLKNHGRIARGDGVPDFDVLAA